MAGHHQQIQRTPCTGSVERTGSFGKTCFADLYVYMYSYKLIAANNGGYNVWCIGLENCMDQSAQSWLFDVICRPCIETSMTSLGKIINMYHFFIWQPSQIWCSVQKSRGGWAHPGSRPTTQRGISRGLTVSLARFRRRAPRKHQETLWCKHFGNPYLILYDVLQIS